MREPIKILIDDGMQIEVGTGIGKYSLYLFESLKRYKSRPVSVGVSGFKKEGSRLFGRFKYLLHINSPKYYRECGEYDIVHYTNYAIPFFRNKRARYVVTVHDLAAFVHTETFSKVYALYSRLITRYSVRHADAVLTDSHAMESELKARWPEYSEKIKAVYPGYYSEFSQSGPVEPDWENEILRNANDLSEKKYFLFVGTIEKRKNISFVIESFLRFKEQSGAKDYKLVLAGRPGYGYDEFTKLVESSVYAGDVIFTGYISSSDCRKLYRQAAAYIFPTIYEGFGSTQLECMANHLPLILSDIPTNREVSGEYGEFFQLDDIDSLVAQMNNISLGKYPTKDKNSTGDAILKSFSWTWLIDDYVDIYLKLKGEKS